MRTIFFIIAALCEASCAGAVAQNQVIDLGEGTLKVSGIIIDNGEWAIFPNGSEGYDPYNRIEEEKCVSLINGNKSDLGKFGIKSGDRVIVEGKSIRYSDLNDGNSESDYLLSKKYFNDIAVNNFCLREYVFIIYDIKKY